MFSSALVAAVLLLSSNVATAAPAAKPTVTVKDGVVVGSSTTIPGAPHKVNEFLGIPFAAKPTRFAAPSPAKPWKKPYQATKQPPACIQAFATPEQAVFFNTPPPPSGESEDCLYINVYAPAGPAPKGGHAVMFWIYGGGLQFGSNALADYNGALFAAEQGVIIVAPNYRTNVFGFPTAPEIPVTERNLGLMDQRLALNWTVDNVAAFGGNPKSITIFGESAGASSVDSMLTTMPNPPFHAAILESGSSALYASDSNTDYTAWNTLVSKLNCSTASNQLSCVQKAPVQAVRQVEETNALSFKANTDNVTFRAFAEVARQQKKVAQVPILIGSNANEGRIFVVGVTNATTGIEAALGVNSSIFVDYLESIILPAYPQGSSPNLANQTDIAAAIFTDVIFQCPAAIVANDSLHTGNPTWRYFFNATFPNTQLLPGLGAYHSSEIPLVYGTYAGLNNSVPSEARLSKVMQTAWANFAKNPQAGPGWAQYPEVGYFYSDLGSQMLNGKMVPVLSEVKAELLDTRCALYTEFYAQTTWT